MTRNASEANVRQPGHPVGAYDTSRMVGRQGLRQRLLDLLRSQEPVGPAVVFLTGEGGIGKTRFLRDLLENAAAMDGVATVSELTDLYHIIHHTPDGLAQAIWQALPASQQAFWTYERERELYQQMQLAGDLRRSSEQHQRTLEAFAQGLQELAKQQKVLLVLDTAERAIYGGRRSGDIKSYEIAESWPWLAGILPRCPNLVLVVAGRFPSLELKTFLLDKNIRTYEEGIQPFDTEDGLDYFKALIETAREQGDEATAINIEALGSDVLHNLHLYAGGLPILLALFVDLLAVSGPEAIPEELRRDPRQATQADGQSLRDWLEHHLIDRLIRSSLGDTLRALGRTPKGADSTLLARIRGIEPEDAEAELAQVRDLSFVKTRPMDERVFLHDVLYEMLARHVYDRSTDAPQSEAAWEAVESYYKDQLEDVHDKMHSLMQPILDQEKGALDLDELGKLTVERQSLLAERVYYLLRHDLARGFEFYYRYSHETIFSGQILLDLLLQAELVTCWTERDPEWQEAEIDGLSRNLLEATIAMRPVARAWASGDYHRTVTLAAQIRKDRPELFSTHMSVNQAVLNAWEALSHVYLGTPVALREAHELLDESIIGLEDVLADPAFQANLTRIWWAKSMLASALRGRGYLQRSQGHLRRSVDDYREAALLGRDVNVLVELARTLNDLGFALAEQGQWTVARSLVKDALDIQQRFGLYALAALSINTLALIAIREGEYASAFERSQIALAVFRTMQYRRGVGLALTALAEAHRRRAGRSVTWSPDRKVANLRDARDWAREAVDIFQEEEERLRQVEALIEVGCACRDWVRIRREHPTWRENVQRLYTEAIEALGKAAELAGEQYLYRRVDALVNLGWLHFYAGQEKALKEAISEAQKAFPDEYFFRPPTGTTGVDRTEAITLLWPQLGKLYVLQGVDQFEAFRHAHTNSDQKKAETALRKAARSFTLGLEYSDLFGREHQGLVQAQETLYGRLKRLERQYLEIVADAIMKTETEFGFLEDERPSSAMRRFLEERALGYTGGG